ncbi:MAG: hypothetical protein ABI977_35350 [Acidobacteriota bacterium]
MADFLTRLIERSRDSAPQEQRVQPLIAPLYAVGPTSVLPDNPVDEALIIETEYPRPSVPLIADSTLVRWPTETISIASSSQRGESPEIKTARATAEKTQNTQLNQTPSIEPLPRTPKSTLPPARLVNARPGLTDPADQSRRANQEPLVIRPRVARVDESGSTITKGTVNEAANQSSNKAIGDQAAPVIRVTIGRIDVRAVTQAPPPARRATPPAPKLSLEDYLRSRNGGKR